MTGIQPTGTPHIGNYLGPIKECLRLNNATNIDHIYVSIVDMHALTSYIGKGDFYNNVHLMVASLVACGVHGSKITIFQQSRVHQHASLAWVLMCICPLSRVQNMPQFKEKMCSVPNDESLNSGLLMYPILQASDILLYSANIVPVGEDQIIHLELARYLRTKLFRHFTNVSESLENHFPIPQIKLCRFPKIYSLRNPGKKMSKSDPDPNSRIELTDTDDKIRTKIRKAVTDSDSGELTFDTENRPGLANLINIFAALKDSSPEDVLDEIRGLTKVTFKDMLSDNLSRSIGPIRQKVCELMHDRTKVEAILSEGHDMATQKASESMDLIWRHLTAHKGS